MKRFLRGLVLGFLVAIPIGALAIIGGGIIAHTHSSASSGGSTLNPGSITSVLTVTGTVPGNGAAIVVKGPDPGNPNSLTDLRLQNSLLNRWLLRKDGTTETGSDAGSDFVIYRFSDGGAQSSLPVISLSRATGNATFSSSILSAKACATNYTRVGPNFCQWNSTVAAATNITTACTSIASPASDAVALLLNLNVDVTSTNTLNAMDQTVIFFYGDTGCVTPNLFAIQYTVREWTATAATSIGSFKTTIIAPNVSGNARAKITAGVAGANSAAVIGYFD